MDSVWTTTGSTSYKDFRRCVTAAAGLFYEYGDFIRSTICIHVENEDQVDDLAQALFVSLVHSPVPEGTQNVKGYLYKVIINDIADADRRERNCSYAMRVYAELCRYPAAQKSPPYLMIQLEQIRKALELIESELPAREAKAVTLRYQKQYSVKEAADRMGVDHMTLRGYTYQGLCRIRERLRNLGVE
jgi:RNA polymerase sigma factor (sigma-70 family)